MDIDLLAKMVKEAIMGQDAVTLPGVGSFVADLMPAVFSDKGYTINPPYRRLYFLPREGDDTALADLYAGANGISQEDALRVLLDFLGEMKEVLKIRKTLVLPGLGRLRATRENNFFFVADEDLDIYPEGLGLEPISLKTHVETPEEVHSVVASLAEALEPEPAAEPEPIVEPEPVIEPETVAEPDPVPATEPEPLAAAPAIAEVPAAVEAPAAPKSRRKGGFWRVLGWILLIVLIVAVAWAIIGRVDPDWVDSFLYTEEELEILRY